MGGGKVGMEVPLVAIIAGMTCWAVGGRQSHPLVSFPTLLCAATTEWSASAVCNLVATSLKTPARPVWSCGADLDGVGRLVLDHQLNQTRVNLSARRESGAAVNCSDLNAMDWRKAKTSPQLSEMVANVSVVAWLFFTVFFFLSSSASLPPSLP